MNENEKKRVELLTKKNEVLNKILEITKDTTFVGDENDAERYVELYETRETFFNEISKIDDELKKDATAFGMEAEAVIKRIKNTISGIIKLDKENEPFAQKAVEFLKGNIKGINVGKSLNQGYNRYASANTGIYFDTKN